MPCDPLRDLRAWQDRMERLAAQHGSPGWVPSVDVYETGDRYVVTAELPGVERNEVEVAVTDGRLTIRGERGADRDRQQFHQLERGHGPFSRSFEFAEGIAADAISADLRDGLLTVVLPKLAAPTVRKIEVT
jgi:HSP20 family protein